MIDALIAGKLQGAPTQRTGQSGKPFVTAKVRVASSDGEGLFVNVITFSTTAGDALLALGDGDSVALSGSLTPKVWTDRAGVAKPSLDLVAHQVLTAYHVTRKRRTMSATDESAPTQGNDRAGRAPAPADGFDDSLDF